MSPDSHNPAARGGIWPSWAAYAPRKASSCPTPTPPSPLATDSKSGTACRTSADALAWPRLIHVQDAGRRTHHDAHPLRHTPLADNQTFGFVQVTDPPQERENFFVRALKTG